MQESTDSISVLLTDSDAQFLVQLGLMNCITLKDLEKQVDSLRMRDLDRLKVLLSRLSEKSDAFSSEIKHGIKKNDLHIFAKAVGLLTAKSE